MLKVYSEGRHKNGFQKGHAPHNKGTSHLPGVPRHSYDDEFKEKLRKFATGRTPWNKGLTKYTYKEYRNIKNKYQRKYRNTIGKLNNKIYKYKRRHLKKQFIHLFSQDEWIKKIEATKGFCPLCGIEVGIEKLTLDHIIPLSKAPKGFIYTIDSVQPLCARCNSKKGNK